MVGVRNILFPGAPARYRPTLMGKHHDPLPKHHQGCYGCGSLAIDLEKQTCEGCGMPMEVRFKGKRASKRWKLNQRRASRSNKRLKHGRSAGKRVYRG